MVSQPVGPAARARSSRLAELAETGGLVLTPGHRFFVDGGGERHLRLPYTFDVDVLDDAVGRLADVWPLVGSDSAGEASGLARAHGLSASPCVAAAFRAALTDFFVSRTLASSRRR